MKPDAEAFESAGLYGYGPVVNLAARAVTASDPGDTLVTEAVGADVEAGGFAASSAGRYALEGIEQPVELFALTRRSP
jgi:class 3 adenylate cyclase